MINIRAKIFYTIDSTHPDISSVKNWTPEREFCYKDTYHINPDCFFGADDIISYIKNDLMTVAGGGYNANHIHNVRFEMKAV